MGSESRTSKSIKNAKVSLFYYIIQMILSFWSRKVFFDNLGSEVVGLQSTAENLFSFLNIAELGVGTSVAYFLYKPLFEKDHSTINEIVALQGWIYRRVACVVIAGACIMMCFFPVIFKNIDIPLWYAYVTFGVILFGSMLGYFINYKSIVLSTDQKGYKISAVTQGFNAFVKIIQIIVLPLIATPFLFYIGSTVICTIFSCLWLNYILYKEYPWLSTKSLNGRKLLKQYPEVITKTKQLFIHKISTVILFNVTPFIMYAYSSLTVVAFYANYLLIVLKIRQVIEMVYSSMGAAVGSLIASGDQEKIKRIFWELYDSRFCISFIPLICIYFLAHPFITLWLGEEYLLPNSLLILLLVSQSIFLTRLTVDHYINGHGLFGDVWAPMAEGVINIVGALVLGYYFSYQGVIMAGILSQGLIILLWKPIYLFRGGLKCSSKSYFKATILRHFLIVLDVVLLSFLFDIILPERMTSYVQFFCYSFIVLLIVSIVIFGEFYFFSQGIRDFFIRVKGVIQKKYQ